MTACFHYNQAIIQEPHNPVSRSAKIVNVIDMCALAHL